jgi:hypothetical protein
VTIAVIGQTCAQAGIDGHELMGVPPQFAGGFSRRVIRQYTFVLVVPEQLP